MKIFINIHCILYAQFVINFLEIYIYLQKEKKKYLK